MNIKYFYVVLRPKRVDILKDLSFIQIQSVKYFISFFHSPAGPVSTK